MLGNWIQRRRDRKALDYSALTTPHPTYGRLDGVDRLVSDLKMLDDIEAQAATVPVDDVPPSDAQNVIAALEAQLQEAVAIIDEQNTLMEKATHVTVAARAFVELVTSQHAKTGEGVFKLNGVDDSDPFGHTLNFRFTDLAAALNDIGRPVAPRLAQGTVH